MNSAVFHYARWQLRDHLMGAGRVIVVAGLVIAVLLWRFMAGNPNAAQGAPAALTQFLSSLGWPLVLLTTAGIISTDRVDGYNRMLFSAPVSPVAFYLQRWLLGGLVVGTLPLVLSVALQFALGTWVNPGPYVAVQLLLYLQLGALTFCWSSFGRRDWAIALSVYLVEGALHGAVVQGMAVPAILAQANRFLPPFHLVGFGAPLEPGTVLPRGLEWVHFVGYAVGLMVVGLTLLRLRPMGSGARG